MRSMDVKLKETVETVWKGLETKANQGKYSGGRIYQRLDIENETGIRLGVAAPENNKEILIELAKGDKVDFKPPRWVGMKFQIIELDVPKKGTRHIRLYLDDILHSEVFVNVCVDIIETLLQVVEAYHRTIKLMSCLEKWNRFFQKHGTGGLSKEAQRGLFGEIFWLHRILLAGMDKYNAVVSWQGCRRNYHDFETKIAIEVKTTIAKEPRKVIINNERQLDDRGIKGLYLFVLTLHVSIAGGQSLADLIDEIRFCIASDIDARGLFEDSLHESGYLDIHRNLYNTRYIVKSEEAFHVREGFPRIIDLPSGTGDITYSLTLSVCTDFVSNMDDVIKAFIGGD